MVQSSLKYGKTQFGQYRTYLIRAKKEKDFYHILYLGIICICIDFSTMYAIFDIPWYKLTLKWWALFLYLYSNINAGPIYDDAVV